MAGSVDLLGFFDRTVVQPENDVTVAAIVLEVGARDGDRFVGVVGKDGQGTRGVEANSLDQRDINARLMNDLVDAVANAVPDVRGGLFLLEVSQHQHLQGPRVQQRVQGGGSSHSNQSGVAIA